MAKTKPSSNAKAVKHHSSKPNPFVTKSPKLTKSDDKAKDSTTTKKKKNKLGPKAIAMKVQPPKPNPFETIWSRRKFDVIGKKRKGEDIRVGRARSQAIEKRKKTLLKEYEQSGKSSVFMDKRIGELDDKLDEYEKAISRTQRERLLKQNKRSKHNLSDGEEDNFEFHSLGALSQRDDFEDEMLPDGDEDDSVETAKKRYQFNSDDQDGHEVDGNENRHKTDKERYAEMILKSKYHKAEKSKEKDENKDLMEELDKKFTSVIASKALANKSTSKHELSASHIFGNSEKEKSDSYDKLERELAMERRAQPSNRTQTPEEIAQEEREQLEQLEEERQKRMLPSEEYSDEENEDAEKSSTMKPMSQSGDDLGDSFSLEENQRTKRSWVHEFLERKDASVSESEGDDSDSGEDSESMEDDDDDEGFDEDNNDGERDILNEDWEQSDDDNLDIDSDEEDEEENSEHESAVDARQKMMEVKEPKKLKKTAAQVGKNDGKSFDSKNMPANKQSSPQSDLPYLIEAPKSMVELDALLDNLCNADIALIIHRIRASNAIKLAAENKKKMQVFYGLLLQYFATLANKKPLNLELLNLLVKSLMEMSMETPYFASICARERILHTRTKFCELVKNPESNCWPASKTLFLLRLWSLIFPCSDFRHVVMTPAIFLMCEYLTRCSVLSGRDAAVGSFICSMLLSITRQSRKFCPEAVMFLHTLLMAAKERKPKSNQDSEIDNLMEFKAPRPLLYIQEHVDQIDPINFLTMMDLPEDSSFFTSDKFRSRVLVTVVETVCGYVSAYEGFSSFPEIFLPISSLVLELALQKFMPSALTDKFKEVAELIKTKADAHCMQRQPLQMRKQKPVAIKMLNPKFEENFVKGRDYDPDRERVERKKLKKRHTQEAKGAVRELRKDNAFLHKVKSRDKVLMEAERAENYGKVRLFLQEQEHAMKSGQLGKGKKRRR